MIFNVGVGIPIGEASYGSDEQFDPLEHTFDETSKYGLEISLHNSPGYSGDGGPCVTLDKSMQRLVWTKNRLRTDSNEAMTNSSSIVLKEPLRKLGYYKDIAVLAYPSLLEENGPVFRDAIDTLALNGANSSRRQ